MMIMIWTLFLILPPAQAENTNVRVCFSQYREELATAALLTAKSKGFFAEEGLNVEFHHEAFQPGPVPKGSLRESNLNREKSDIYLKGELKDTLAVYALQNNECDFLSTSFEALMMAPADPKKMHVVGLYLYGGEYDTALLTGKNSKIKTIADLKGKTVRIGQIGTRIVLEKMLKKNGMGLSDVKLAMAMPEALPQGLADSKYDAVIAYSPTTPLLLASQSARVLEKNIYSNYLGTFLPHSVLIGSSQMFKNADVYARFVRAFRKAATYIQANPLATITAMNDERPAGNTVFNYSGYTPAVVQKSASFFHISKPYYTDASDSSYKKAELKKSIELFHQELRDIGYLKQNVDLNNFYSLLNLNGV